VRGRFVSMAAGGARGRWAGPLWITLAEGWTARVGATPHGIGKATPTH
jgi:hypothetical protein